MFDKLCEYVAAKTLVFLGALRGLHLADAMRVVWSIHRRQVPDLHAEVAPAHSLCGVSRHVDVHDAPRVDVVRRRSHVARARSARAHP